MANVSLRRLSKTFASTTALRDVTLEVADGEYLVLVGPSGAGKSTLLNLVAGLERPDAGGEIVLGGKAIQDLSAHDRDVALVLGEDTLYPHLTVAENLGFALRMRGAPEAETKKRVAEAVNLLGLDGLLTLRPAELSRGEALRMALGKAVARQPKVILLDEPLKALDHHERLACRTTLIQLQQRLQATMIHATRDGSDALMLGSQVVVMRHGGVEQAGTPIQVYQEPANTFVAGTVGNPPMNLVPGRLSSKNDQLIFKETGGGVVEIRWKESERPALKNYLGKDVVLGIRPEQIELASEAGENVTQALVDYVEASGAETIFHLQTGQQALVARTRATVDAREAGRRARFHIDPARVHVFDPATDRRIV